MHLPHNLCDALVLSSLLLEAGQPIKAVTLMTGAAMLGGDWEGLSVAQVERLLSGVDVYHSRFVCPAGGLTLEVRKMEAAGRAVLGWLGEQSEEGSAVLGLFHTHEDGGLCFAYYGCEDEGRPSCAEWAAGAPARLLRVNLPTTRAGHAPMGVPGPN